MSKRRKEGRNLLLITQTTFPYPSQLKSLLDCCCRRKRFYAKSLLGKKSLDACLLRALRDDATSQLALCDLLEMELVGGAAEGAEAEGGAEGEGGGEGDQGELQQQIITTLMTTAGGRAAYEELCQRQYHLKEIVSDQV